jgi:hypothetical protein
MDDDVVAGFDDIEPRTPEERAFLGILLPRVPDLDVRLDSVDGWTPWISVMLEFFFEGDYLDSARLDYDGRSIKGGFDGSFGQDGGTPFDLTEIKTEPPDGIAMVGAPDELAAAAATWFEDVRARWRDGRGKRWGRF